MDGLDDNPCQGEKCPINSKMERQHRPEENLETRAGVQTDRQVDTNKETIRHIKHGINHNREVRGESNDIITNDDLAKKPPIPSVGSGRQRRPSDESYGGTRPKVYYNRRYSGEQEKGDSSRRHEYGSRRGNSRERPRSSNENNERKNRATLGKAKIVKVQTGEINDDNNSLTKDKIKGNQTGNQHNVNMKRRNQSRERRNSWLGERKNDQHGKETTLNGTHNAVHPDIKANANDNTKNKSTNNHRVEPECDSSRKENKKSTDSSQKDTKGRGKRNISKREQKAKCTHLYVVICDEIKNEVRIPTFLRRRMGHPKSLDFNITEVMKMTGKNDGCTLVTLELASLSKASAATYLLNKSNRNSSSKVHCFSNQYQAMDQDLQPAEHREKSVIKALQELVETTSQVVKRHDEKIANQEQTLGVVLQNLSNKKGVSFVVFERFSNEREALNDKLTELRLQRIEFTNYIKGTKAKLADVVGHDKYENDLKEIRKALGVECRRLEAALPMYARREDILTVIKDNQVSVILGETGSGKSTQMVQYLYQAGFGEKGLIACTQPRKIAAVSLATHVSKEIASSVGQTVGYHVGMQSKKSAVTKVVFMTDHILLNECLSDRMLTKYACVIIDEAHERSIHTDLLLGLLKECLPSRPDLRVVITSATIDPDIFVNYFGGSTVCPVLAVSGRAFPVDIIWDHDQLCDSPYPDFYESKALEKAIEIHTTTNVDEGDVLVFLTSAIETEKCVERFKQRVGEANSVCLQLHGRLKPEEQQLVFTPTPRGKRKVVFATNIAETSITIDGIKFVVDTGVVKEMQFDPRKNMSSLDVVSVSKSSANQRKGRAGRTSSGTCYRLYSEADYKKMEKCGTPEILRIQVSQAMLKLLQLGVNPTSFKYVQSPSPAAMELALDDLKTLDAVDKSGIITELGKWIARLPVEPRLGVMVKKGIDLEVPSESLVVASCCNQSGIFFRVGSQEEKKAADMKKLKFCHTGGDLLTMLSVYREWDKVNEKAKGRWCSQNSINGKAMKAVRDMMNEMLTVLRKEVNLKIKHQFADPQQVDSKVQKLVFECMRSNLGYYLGHESAGYLIVNRHQRVQQHPSSSLVSLASQPTWVVFNRVLKTSSDFITEITPVLQDAIDEAKAENKIVLDESSLALLRVERIRTFPVGRYVFWKFVGPMHRNRRFVETNISEVCNDSTVIIEANKQRGEISLFCVPHYKEVAADMLNESIRPVPEQLINECREEPITDRNGESVGVRAILGVGGAVVDILMPNQFRSLNIKVKAFSNITYTEDELGGILSYHGPIEQIWKTCGKKNQTSEYWGRVTFTKEIDAVAAAQDINDDEDSELTLVPITYTSQRKNIRQEYTIKLQWCRRHAKGHCYIHLKRPEDMARLLMNRITVGESRVSIEPAKRGLDSLYMKGLKFDVTERDILESLEECLEIDTGTGKERFGIVIPRENVLYKTDELHETQGKLVAILSRITRPDTFKLTVCRYGEKTVMGIAFVTCYDAAVAETVHRGIEEDIIAINGHLITADFEFKSSIHINKRTYTVVKDDISMAINKLRRSGSTQACLRELRSGHFAVDITSTKLTKLATAKVLFDGAVQGEVLVCGEVDNLHLLFCKEGRQKVQQIAQSTKTLISVDGRQEQITIQGSYDNKAQAVVKIDEELSKHALSQEREIKLKGDDNPPGLMKALFEKYELKFHKLKAEAGLSTIIINMRHHEISMTGNDEALDTALTKVKELRQTLQEQQTFTGCGFDLPDCPICLCPVEESDMSRLEYCGHAYCKSCLVNQIKTAIVDRKFPIVCASEGCEMPMVIRDINTQIKTGAVKRHGLAKSAIEAFVPTVNDKFRFCLTPDCQMVYKVTQHGERFICSLCHKHICTSCHHEFHDGLTCAMYDSARQDGDSVLQWIKEDPANRKLCPKCDCRIEKIDGCDHMTCTCGVHICWKCLKFFTSSGKCYGHLRDAHGSFV